MITRQDIYDLNSVQDLMDLWNDYCHDVAMYDEIIDHNDEGFLSNFEPLELAQRIYYGDYHYYDDFITFDGRGNFKTLSSWGEIIDYIDIDALIDWMNRNEVTL